LAIHPEILYSLKMLQNDQDVDVRYFAGATLEYISSKNLDCFSKLSLMDRIPIDLTVEDDLVS
jgi:hypothetical protein